MQPVTVAAFDPAQFKELEIKGSPPDGTISWSAIVVPPAPKTDDALHARGKELFAKACAGCHGNEGKGDGPITKSWDLPSAPANLSMPVDSIKIRSTYAPSGSVPLDTDLYRTLTRGLPGTVMWSFKALPPDDRWDLAGYVRTLSPQYTSAPAEPGQIPPKIPNDAGVREFGAKLFNSTCFNCHGINGQGANPPLKDPQTGREFVGLGFARDHGEHMLSGNSEEDIARTVMCGFHMRSLMRSFRPFIYDKDNPSAEEKALMDRKFWGLVFYVRELMK